MRHVVEEFSYTGKTYAGACAAGPAVGRCEYADDGENVSHEFDVAGRNATSIVLNATLTWEAQSPSMEELVVQLSIQTPEGWTSSSEFPSVKGRSPLSLSWDLSPYRSTNVSLDVFHVVSQDVPSGFVNVHSPQAFTAEGTIDQRLVADAVDS